MRKKSFINEGHEENFWPAFTDMISTIALILFFLMLLSYVQNIITSQSLASATAQLTDSKAQISKSRKKLMLLRDRIDEIKAEVERGELALKLSEDKIEDQREIIAESNKELGELRSKLQGIALLRLDVLKKVKGSIESEIGSKNSSGERLVTIGDNGNIVINEGLVFDYNSSKVKSDGKRLLAELSRSFEKVLDDPATRESIDAISIQGHTDSVGSSQYNRNLSAERATNVLNYLMESNPDLELKYGKYFAASGYSEFRPISKGTSSSSQAKNRRIEISIILKDENIQDVINDYLSDSMAPFEQ